MQTIFYSVLAPNLPNKKVCIQFQIHKNCRNMKEELKTRRTTRVEPTHISVYVFLNIAICMCANV